MLAEAAPIGVVLGIGLVVALVVVGAIFAAKAAKARRDALMALARTLGFSYDPSDGGVPARLAQFSLFGQGKRRNVYNTLSGQLSVHDRVVLVVMGDYRYTTESGSGKNRTETTRRVSYLHVVVPYPATANLGVRREHWGDKIAGAIGFDDIDFESAEFSRTYHVKCDDRKFAYDLFEPRMIEWFQASDPPPLQLMRQDLLISTGGTWKPEIFEARVRWVCAFLERWPAHLIDRLDTLAGSSRPA